MALRLPLFPPPKKKVAIAVPLSTRPELTEGERISLRHLQHHLGGYDIFFIVPPGTAPDLPEDAAIVGLDAKYFGSNVAHSRLQLSPEFYERFIDYEYVLMYHLDALVFSDQLEQWCEMGLDYIGAPWFKTEDTPWVEEPEVGNSGFALFNVRGMLRALYSNKRRVSFKDELNRPNRNALINLACALRRLLPFRNNVQSHIKAFLASGRLSDIFLSRHLKHYYPEFKIATVEQALQFAFEVDPTGCFEKTGQQLPFGCHAWERYDPDFWLPFLMKDNENTAA